MYLIINGVIEMIKEITDEREIEKIEKLMKDARRIELKIGEVVVLFEGVLVERTKNSIRILIDGDLWQVKEI